MKEAVAASVIPRIVFFVLVLLAVVPELRFTNAMASLATWDDWEKATGTFENIATILALFTGGIWTYFTFIKGRTLRPRLEPKVSGKVINKNNTRFLLAAINLKNTGTSKVEIVQNATGLFLDAYTSGATNAKEVAWTELDAIRVLTDHHWIEPGETIEEPVLFPLLGNEVAILKLRLKINSHDQTWITATLIDPQAANAAGQPG